MLDSVCVVLRCVVYIVWKHDTFSGYPSRLVKQHTQYIHLLCSRTNFANPNIHNMKKIADLYAEVIGVLSQSRFHSVRRKFFVEIRNPQNSSNTIISIIEGMSFIRVKMFPVDDLEQWFAFLQVCVLGVGGGGWYCESVS